MDHDKQVKDLTTQTTIGRFLNRSIVADDRDRDNFDLEKEFAKSAKNKSPLVPLVVAAFLVVLAVGAWVASQFTEQASQESSASIGSFEDLKLKEIFDTARKNKKDLETIQAQIDELTQASNAKVIALTQTGNSKADIASVNDASGNEAKAIQAQTAKQIAAEKASLKTALAPLRTQAEDVQKKIDSYDDRIGQMNKKNQQVLDTQMRLFDLEKQKITNQYEARLQQQTDEALETLARVKKERDDLVAALKAKQAEDTRKLILKYNPVIADPALVAQIDAYGTVPAPYPGTGFPERIESSQVLTTDLQKVLADRVARAHLLIKGLRDIPYQNSVPPLINALDNAIAESLAGYDGYLTPLAGELSRLDSVIADRESEIETLQTNLAASIAERQDLENVRAQENATYLQEKAVAQAYLARWTGAIDDFVLSMREDGVLVDVRDPLDWMVVLKADRAKALKAAIDLAAATPPPVLAPGKTAPVVPPVNLATLRDGSNNNELGTATIEFTPAGWRAKLVKLFDPKKPFKAFDRIVLSLPVKK